VASRCGHADIAHCSADAKTEDDNIRTYIWRRKADMRTSLGSFLNAAGMRKPGTTVTGAQWHDLHQMSVIAVVGVMLVYFSSRRKKTLNTIKDINELDSAGTDIFSRLRCQKSLRKGTTKDTDR
jgi:hypothetical protein